MFDTLRNFISTRATLQANLDEMTASANHWKTVWYDTSNAKDESDRRAAALLEENDTLRKSIDEKATMLAFLSKEDVPKLLRAGPEQGTNSFLFEFSSKLFGVFARSAAEMLKSFPDAKNYLSFEMHDYDVGPLSVVIQRKFGKTPSQLVAETKAELEKEREQHRRTQGHLDDFQGALAAKEIELLEARQPRG